MSPNNLEQWMSGEIGAAGYDISRLLGDIAETAKYCLKHPRMTLPIVLALGGIISSACGGLERNGGVGTAVPTAIGPTSTETVAAVDPISTNPAGWGSFPEGLTPTAVVATATSAPENQNQAPVELFVPPTAQEALIGQKQELPIPDYAKAKYDSMVASIDEVAKATGFASKDIKVVFVPNNLHGNESRWTLVYETPTGNAWSKVKSTDQLGQYPTYFGPETDNVMGKKEGVTWENINGEFGWAGTTPIMKGVKGQTVDGGQDAYASFVVPSGLTSIEIHEAKSWQTITGVEVSGVQQSALELVAPTGLPEKLGYKPFYSGTVKDGGYWLANKDGSGVGSWIFDEQKNEWREAKITEKINFQKGFDIPYSLNLETILPDDITTGNFDKQMREALALNGMDQPRSTTVPVDKWILYTSGKDTYFPGRLSVHPSDEYMAAHGNVPESALKTVNLMPHLLRGSDGTNWLIGAEQIFYQDSAGFWQYGLVNIKMSMGTDAKPSAKSSIDLYKLEFNHDSTQPQILVPYFGWPNPPAAYVFYQKLNSEPDQAKREAALNEMLKTGITPKDFENLVFYGYNVPIQLTSSGQ